MQVNIDPTELEPIIAATVEKVLARIREDEAALGDEIAFDEPKAARLISVESHVLRDTRLRGEISASRIVGRRIRYTRQDLLDYLAKTRIK